MHFKYFASVLVLLSIHYTALNQDAPSIDESQIVESQGFEGYRNEISFSWGRLIVLSPESGKSSFSILPSNYRIGYRHNFGSSFFFQTGLSYIRSYPSREYSYGILYFNGVPGDTVYSQFSFTQHSIGLPISFGLQTSMLKRIGLRGYLGVIPTYNFSNYLFELEEKIKFFQFSNALIGCETSFRAGKAISLNFSIEYLQGFSYGSGKETHFKTAMSSKFGISGVF
jgi:hypothetical protein